MTNSSTNSSKAKTHSMSWCLLFGNLEYKFRSSSFEESSSRDTPWSSNILMIDPVINVKTLHLPVLTRALRDLLYSPVNQRRLRVDGEGAYSLARSDLSLSALSGQSSSSSSARTPTCHGCQLGSSGFLAGSLPIFDSVPTFPSL